MYKTLPNEDDEQRKSRLQKEAREFKVNPCPEVVEEDEVEEIEEEVIPSEEEEVEEKNPIKRVYRKIVKKNKKGKK